MVVALAFLGIGGTAASACGWPGAGPSPAERILGAESDSLGLVPSDSLGGAPPTSDSSVTSSELTPAAPEHRSKPKLVPLRDARHALGTLASDAWLVISSPARMDRHDALLALGIAGVAGILYANDQEIQDAFLRSQGETVYDLMVKPGRAIEPVGNMGNTLAFYGGGMLIGYAFHIDPLRELTSEFIESHWLSGSIRNVGEITIGRARPYEGKGARDFRFQGGSSFPSGHASVVVELATILSHHAHSLPFSVLAYGAATSACLERIDAEGLWASDVWVGAVTGHFIAKAVTRLHDQRRAARHAETGWRESIQPIAGRCDGNRFLGLTMRF
jgi:hypothetical protein